jgi:[ribosomal protein S5]-alanine N-acetyltransferase
MEIDLKICKVRPWQWKDKESLVYYADNKNIWINLRDRFPSPYSETDADSWLKLVVDKKPVTEFAIEVDDKAVGGIGFVPNDDVHRLQAEIGYWLGEEYWGRGIATASIKAVSEYAFAEFKLIRLYASVFEWNIASSRVLEKAGYNFEGRLKKSIIKDGKIIDQLVYAKV